MKVIDLLNTPLDKLPKKIKIEDTIYNLLIDEDNLIYYQNEECKYFMYSISCFNELNEEVEIIEEDKEIEILLAVNGSDLVDLQKNSTLEKQNKAVTNLIMYLNANVKKTNELIRAVNDLKKGK